MIDWDSKQYLKFEKERTQPAMDLADHINIKAPRKIADIGCGPGNSTAVLAARFPDSYILGVDNSENMISTARSNCPGLDFQLCDIRTELSHLDTNFDIVFSNACIQWVPNHEKLLPELMSLLKKGGVLAVQIPMNYKEPIHQIIGEVVSSEKWAEYFSNPRIFHTLTQSDYFHILSEASDDFRIWETTYCHVMESHAAIMEWYRGTGLRPYLSALSQERIPEFEKDIMEQLIIRYPIQKNGKIIFRFPRFFFTALSK